MHVALGEFSSKLATFEDYPNLNIQAKDFHGYGRGFTDNYLLIESEISTSSMFAVFQLSLSFVAGQ